MTTEFKEKNGIIIIFKINTLKYNQLNNMIFNNKINWNMKFKILKISN